MEINQVLKNEKVQKSNKNQAEKSNKEKVNNLKRNFPQKITNNLSKNNVLVEIFHHKSNMCHHRRKFCAKLVRQGHFKLSNYRKNMNLKDIKPIVVHNITYSSY